MRSRAAAAAPFALRAGTGAAVATLVLGAAALAQSAPPASTKPSAAPAPATSPALKPAPPPTYPIAGRLTLTEKGTPARDASIDLREGAVWFEPDAGATPPKPQRAEMATLKKQFVPQFVVVPAGSTVGFPNQDPILHNVFSVSGKNKFDLGLAGTGKGKSVVFREAGLVRVFCNVHHAMFANVLVVKTPYFAQLDENGAFRLPGVPGGPGQLFYWHGRGEPGSRRLSVPAGGEVRIELPITVARVPAHKNKQGKSYARGSYD